MEAALERKMKATIAAPKEEDSEAEIQQYCELPESRSSYCCHSRWIGLSTPEEGAAG
jgi:hypothetical protein